MKKNNKGFTLAELLIVVAIIAVLVAIAIPIFTSRLEQSRETTDIANLRSAYAAGQVAALSGIEGKTASQMDGEFFFDPDNGDGIVASESDHSKLGQGTATDGKADTSKLPSVCKYTNAQDHRNKSIKVAFDSQGVVCVAFDGDNAYSKTRS